MRRAVPSLIAFVCLPFAALAAQIDATTLSRLQPRNIGPAGMSGRIAAIDAVGADARTVYVASSTGGLWKSGNGGLTWTPVTDSLRTSSMGAVAVNPTNPDIVWLGTGEGNPRNSAGVGYGLYKSIDGGRTWTLLGLEKTEHIHR